MRELTLHCVSWKEKEVYLLKEAKASMNCHFSIRTYSFFQDFTCVGILSKVGSKMFPEYSLKNHL